MGGESGNEGSHLENKIMDISIKPSALFCRVHLNEVMYFHEVYLVTMFTKSIICLSLTFLG